MSILQGTKTLWTAGQLDTICALVGKCPNRGSGLRWRALPLFSTQYLYLSASTLTTTKQDPTYLLPFQMSEVNPEALVDWVPPATSWTWILSRYVRSQANTGNLQTWWSLLTAYSFHRAWLPTNLPSWRLLPFRITEKPSSLALFKHHTLQLPSACPDSPPTTHTFIGRQAQYSSAPSIANNFVS